MTGIILGFFLAFILLPRSIESVITNEITLKKIENFHNQIKMYIDKFTATTFNTASKGILTNSLKYIIWFFGGIYFITLFVFGIAINTGNTNMPFILQEFRYIAVIIFIPILLSIGLKRNFSSFYENTKNNMLKIIKSPIALFLIISYYSLILLIYCLSFVFLEKFN
ncbi:hypothetical protein [Chryseobacterium polytrichastri]|uniref:Uncharacterized protein n=1 Tax=Chryseobacterium polytrichastri TaxID=1302687 RepID=A0A1M6TBL5_9FLAO|nr:hypothetical protein [Chryseobacterium polytrichastri]SHK54226.1 hypothetical protein SAMN05444267_100540 [Chryseobacterium polytrichastri]